MTSINILKMLDDSIDMEISEKEIEALSLTESLVKLDKDITKLRSIKRLLHVEFNQQEESLSTRKSGE